jgi:uncharacterized cupin superfamily protein
LLRRGDAGSATIERSGLDSHVWLTEGETPMSPLRAKLIRNVDEVEFETSDRAPLYDGGRSALVIGPRVAGSVARKLGASIDVLPPGKRGCPYHFHYAQEEMFVIVEGSGTLRVAGEMIPVAAGDVIAIPPGPEYPHQIINTSDAPLKYLSIST